MHDTEDRPFWYEYGAQKERQFVDFCKRHPEIELNCRTNPRKAREPYLLDLLVEEEVAELKTQNTPFFRARAFYGIDPRFCVSFNRKDYNNYRLNCPDTDIYFWVDWRTLKMEIHGFVYKVAYLGGIYKVNFRTLQDMIESHSREHHYRRRAEDQRPNAKSSFGVDIRQLEAIYQKGVA